MEINALLCLSIKSKGSYIQCPHPKKQNSDFCGIHFKSKNITRIDKIINNSRLSINAIKIQKSFRRWNIFRRTQCNNKEDCGTLDNILTIPIEYYFQYKDIDGFIYAFDIRTLEMIKNTINPINPYNQKPFPNNELFLKKLNSKIDNIKKKNKNLSFDSPKLTEEQKYQQFLLRVFQKFDMTGQYTDINWFDDLSIEQLKKLYQNANDMFSYRAQLPIEILKKIIKNGKIFTQILNEVSYFKHKHKRILQIEILKEMERIIDEAEDKEYKILGVNLILTVLVEINYQAAIALPHLVQSSFLD